ncbi:MAG: hypothetical protein D6160_18955 [Ketobacter sp.]|nr:MAG: hypothetical protein D6160_18955 [Ketobacter sp.]
MIIEIMLGFQWLVYLVRLLLITNLSNWTGFGPGTASKAAQALYAANIIIYTIGALHEKFGD